MLLLVAKTMCERIQSCSDPEEEGVGQVFWIPPLENREFYSLVGNVSTTDARLTADPGVASSIPDRSHTFMEIDHEIMSTVILLPSADSFKKCCCQLQANVCARITG